MGRIIVTVGIVLFISSLFPSLSTADLVNYFYDDSGRLIKAVSDKGETLVYSYDAVGNLISITNQTVNPNLPALSNITPDTSFTGTTTSATITGSNLLTVQSVTSDNGGITISGIQSTDTQITAVLHVSQGAALGQTNITVKTLYGSASIGVQIFRATLNPAALYMQIGETKQISVSVAPLPQEGLTVIVDNPSPDEIETPRFITIPSEGSGTFTVKGVKEGMVVLGVGGARSAVFVSSPLTGPLSISSRAVCTYIALSSGSLLETNPVSVMVGPVVSGGFTSIPVSVQWVAVSNGIVISEPVCVTINNQ